VIQEESAILWEMIVCVYFYDKANVFTAEFNKFTEIHFTNHSNFTSLLFYLNIVLTIQQTSFY